jgi:endonuclease YncB( thermonuclease family)
MFFFGSQFVQGEMVQLGYMCKKYRKKKKKKKKKKYKQAKKKA